MKIRRCFALPLLRKRDIKKMWPILREFRNDYSGEIRAEMNSYIVYLTNNWITKIDKGQLLNFNKLTRTRSTNPVEAWHSVIKRLFTCVISYTFFLEILHLLAMLLLQTS